MIVKKVLSRPYVYIFMAMLLLGLPVMISCKKGDTWDVSPPPPPPDTSSLPFKNGINAHQEYEWQRWQSWTGRPVDVVTVFPTRSDGWAGFTQYTWEFDNLASFGGKMDFAIPLFPDGQSNLTDCAAGAYDDYWKQFGSLLAAHGRGSSYVRPAWEFNGDYFEGSRAGDSALWIASFRRVVNAIRSTAPGVKIEWVMNAHGSPPGYPPGGNAWSVYPGDEYVDIIGIDNYDMYPPSHNDQEWDAQCNDIHGLCYVIEQARAHHKQFCVPEWGVSNKSPNGGGDNAYFITKMFNLFKDNADIMAYEAYFNDGHPDNVMSELFNIEDNKPTTINPAAAAKFLELFGRKQ